MGLLIRASLTHQEQRRVAAGTSGAGKRVLIIGGAGKMGAWFAHFLSSQGFAIEISDPSPAAVAFPRVADWREWRARSRSHHRGDADEGSRAKCSPSSRAAGRAASSSTSAR